MREGENNAQKYRLDTALVNPTYTCPEREVENIV